MASAIEARSLSALSVLAANPPQYPRNPTHRIQESLVLYIAKVPGSRDVFLTTVKPQQRVVTAHDIENSLYYFHIDKAEDEEIREALKAEEDAKLLSESSSDGQRRVDSGDKAFKRKPLPANPHPGVEYRPEPPPKVYPHFQIPNYIPKRPYVGRKPLLNSGADTNPTSDTGDKPPELPPRKPMGPRPLQSRQMSTDTTSTVDSRAESPDLWKNNLGQVPGLSVTIIRRDPSSGGQWNVGKLITRQGATRQGSSFSMRKRSNSSTETELSIEIFSLGYNKFIDYSQGSSTSASVTSLNISDERHKSSKNPVFSRQLLLANPRRPLTQSPTRQNASRFSQDSARSSDSIPCSPSGPTFFRPYTFLSPWNGICEFLTSLTGGSIKCKHTLPMPSSPGNIRPPAYTISELRFNLPKTKLSSLLSPKRKPVPSGPGNRSSVSALRSPPFLQSQMHSRSQSVDSQFTNSSFTKGVQDSDEDSDSQMDMSLGREQAGGGIRGKQAKLGKLIVEDEGQKMLDLVVAANMGVWWSVYGWEEATQEIL